MKSKLLAFVVVLLLAAPAMADISPVAGGSISVVEKESFSGTHVTGWLGAHVKQVKPHIALWGAYQQRTVEDPSVTGRGGKAIFAINHKKYEDLILLVGGGVLSNFALEGNGVDRTSAATFDLGILYEWWIEEVYIGGLGSAVDYGPRFEYSIDFGVLLRF
jgi:hypothetical protein